MAIRRYVPWITAAVTILIIVLLIRALRRYDLAQVVQSLREVSFVRLTRAIAFAAASYVTLTLFDTLAIRYLGCDLPYRKIALASFTSLSIGHNVGLAALSSGAIRYRFYTRWGLSPADVAKLIVFCAITVGLGLATLGGIALLLRPQLAAALTGLAPSLTSGLGAACLLVSALWLGVAAARRKPVRVFRSRVDVPPLRLAAAQIVVGTMNFAFVAGALHQAISTVAEVPYPSVAAVYVIGNVAAIASHVPGGLGVIEAVVVYLLPQQNIIGAVILFRIVYYLLPLPIGCISFIVSEILDRRRRRQIPAVEACDHEQPARTA
ncbi:MAG TPA: lysylphosphatidylglycerol synthase domain-containing protein [Alphaproteobacteria bacterium]